MHAPRRQEILEYAFFVFSNSRGVHLMLSNKKAQGMSLNTVIIAIIVLVVLVVLVMIFTGYFGKIFTPGVKSCETGAGGRCSTTACTDNERTLASYAAPADATKAQCADTAKFCCTAQLI